MGDPPIDGLLAVRHHGTMSDQNNSATMVSAPAEAVPAKTNGVSADSRNWGVLTHLSAFVMLFGIPAVVGPVIVWAIKKQEDPYVDFHGKEAVNFNISFLIYTVVAAVLILLLVGVILLPLVLLTWFVLVIVGAVKAGAGEYYRYPFTIRWVQ